MHSHYSFMNYFAAFNDFYKVTEYNFHHCTLHFVRADTRGTLQA